MSSSEQIPSGWAVSTLGELGSWTGGGTPSKSEPRFWADGSIPWVSPKDMKSPVIHDSIDHITPVGIDETATNLIPPGSVLFVTRSGILAHTFPVARNSVPVTINQDVKALTPASGVNPDYIAWAARTHGPSIIDRCSKDGTTVTSIDTTLLQAFRLPIAPYQEQHRVVEAIESCFTRLDHAEATLERVQRNLERYRASVLKAAVEGRLVRTEAELARAEGRDYEPASTLLERIRAERRRRWEEAEFARLQAKGKPPRHGKWKAKYGEPPAPKVASLSSLPEGWCWSSVGQLGDVTGGLTQNAKRSQLPFQLPFLRVANVYADELRLGDVKTIGVHESEIERARLVKDDLLIVEGNGSIEQIGRVALWDGSIERCVHQNHLIKVRFYPTMLAHWVLCWLLSPAGRAAIERTASSTSGLHTLSLSKVSQLPVPLPPASEQARAISEVERASSVASATALEVERMALRCARLRQSILKWAFQGRLVDQDPSDEPASELLDRIRAERASTKERRTRGRRQGKARAMKK